MSPFLTCDVDNQRRAFGDDLSYGSSSCTFECLDARGSQPSIGNNLRNVCHNLTENGVLYSQDVPAMMGNCSGHALKGLAMDDTECLQDHSRNEEHGYMDPLNGLTAEEAEFLQELGWTNNNLASDEEEFLRENNLDEPDLIVHKSPPLLEAVYTPDIPSLWCHEAGCKCRFPQICTAKTEPPQVHSDPLFGPVGQGRPSLSRASASNSPSISSPEPCFTSPSTSTSTTRSTLPSQFPVARSSSRSSGSFGVVDNNRSAQTPTPSTMHKLLPRFITPSSWDQEHEVLEQEQEQQDPSSAAKRLPPWFSATLSRNCENFETILSSRQRITRFWREQEKECEGLK